MEEIEIFVETCREGIALPQYANYGDAGMDICAAEDVIINPGQTVVIPTGLKVAIPVGYEIQVRPRSGISLKNPLRIPNTPGTIDSGYREEIGVIMTNTSELENINKGPFRIGEKGNNQGIYEIKKGDIIGQVVFQKFLIVDNDNATGERTGGFGSTDNK